MASEREQLQSLIDQLPENQLPALRRAIENLLHPAPQNVPTRKKYPERTAVGGIITPQ